MIVNGGETKFRYIGSQDVLLGASPQLSFDLTTQSVSNDFSFGYCFRSGFPIVGDKFDCRSGLVIDNYDRVVGTYQSGVNNFSYSYDGDSLFRINGGLVSINNNLPSLSSYLSSDAFFFQNRGTTPVEFDLNISGFHPPIAFGRLLTADYVTFTGEMFNPNGQNYSYRLLGVNPGYEFLTGVPLPPQGYVFTQSGNFVLSGNAGASQSIPVTLDFDFGRYIQNFIVSTTGEAAGTGAGGGDAFYFNIIGSGNSINRAGYLDFEVDYYSTSPKLLNIEMPMSSGSSVVAISGNASGAANFQGYVVGSGYVYATQITGEADFSKPWNSGYNSQYQSIPTKVNVVRYTGLLATGYFVGDYTYSWAGLEMEREYFPFGSDQNETYTGTGYGSVTVSITEADKGVYVASYINGIIPQEGNPPFPPGNYQSAAYLIGPVYITGEGNVSFTSGINFLGYADAKVSPAVAKVDVTATGVIDYVGNMSQGYVYDYPNLSLPPEPNPGILSSYSIYTGGSAYGTAIYEGNTILAAGDGGVDYFYPRGKSNIVIDGLIDGQTNITDHLVEFTGTSPYPPGGTVTDSFTGYTVGYGFIKQGLYPGPTFSGYQDATMYPYNENSRTGFSTMAYGRGMITGSYQFNPTGVTGIGLWFPADGGVAYFTRTWEKNIGGYDIEFTNTYTLPVDKLTPTLYVEDDITKAVFVKQPNMSFAGLPYLSLIEDQTHMPFTGDFDGQGWIAGAAGYPFQLDTGNPENGVFVNFEEQQWTGANKYVKSGIPFGAGFRSFTARVSYESEIPGNTDEAILKVSIDNVTGQVVISGFGA